MVDRYPELAQIFACSWPSQEEFGFKVQTAALYNIWETDDKLDVCYPY